MKELWKTFKKLWWIVKNYDIDKIKTIDRIDVLSRRVEAMHKRLGQHTIVHTDIHMHTPCVCIAVGTYLDREYVRVFNVSAQSFPELVDMLHNEEKYSTDGKWHMPYKSILDVSSTYKRR